MACTVVVGDRLGVGGLGYIEAEVSTVMLMLNMVAEKTNHASGVGS